MQKCLSLRTGQIPLQKYWKQLFGMIQRGEIDPSKIISHHMKLEDAKMAYEIFDNKTDGVIKIVLTPSSIQMASSVMQPVTVQT